MEEHKIIEHKKEHAAQHTAPEKNGKRLYDRYYKIILIFPAIIFIFSIIYLINFYNTNGDVIYKDVSLTGGTTVTVFDSNVDIVNLKEALKQELGDIEVREISDIRTGRQRAFFVETKSDAETIKNRLEEYLGYDLDNENSSVEFSGSTLSEGFYKQLRIAMVIAFVLMAMVVFFIFRSSVPSLAVILAAFADITMTLAVVNLLGFKLSSAGIVAFLMLIGYSVDTDILLTTRLLKSREGLINERIAGSFKTGITMTLTAIAAIATSLFLIYHFSDTLRQMFIIILIGLGFDILNTWVTNASMLKWYMEAKKIE